MCNPRLWKFVLCGLYIPVFLQFEWLRKHNIKTVIDIGGHHGRVSKVLKYFFPKGYFYIFEPIPENIEIIKKNVHDSRTVIENIALTNTTGTKYFNKYKKTEVSSLLTIHENYKNLSGGKFEKIKINTTTLDEYFEKINMQHPVFLKIDTQGSEGIILKSGIKTLKHIDIIHIEMTFEEIYKNESLFNEVYTYLTRQGFYYRGEINESYFYPRFKPNRQINAIFVKRNYKDIYE